MLMISVIQNKHLITSDCEAFLTAAVSTKQSE
jgi:RNase H-like domain found in reverse transcriptase/Reverse transcriptase (RNA-dependent DNA polymerase)